MSDPKQNRVQEIFDEAVGFGGHSAWLGSANITAVVRVLVERVAALELREATPVPNHPSEDALNGEHCNRCGGPLRGFDYCAPTGEPPAEVSGERNVCVVCGQSGDFSSCPNCDGDRGLVRYVRLDAFFKLRALNERREAQAKVERAALSGVKLGRDMALAELEAVKRERDELLRQVLTELDEDQVEREKAMAVVEAARDAATWLDKDGSVGMCGAVFDELKQALAAFDAKEGKP